MEKKRENGRGWTKRKKIKRQNFAENSCLSAGRMGGNKIAFVNKKNIFLYFLILKELCGGRGFYLLSNIFSPFIWLDSKKKKKYCCINTHAGNGAACDC